MFLLIKVALLKLSDSTVSVSSLIFNYKNGKSDQGHLSGIMVPGQSSALWSLPTQLLTGITKVNGR